MLKDEKRFSLSGTTNCMLIKLEDLAWDDVAIHQWLRGQTNPWCRLNAARRHGLIDVEQYTVPETGEVVDIPKLNKAGQSYLWNMRWDTRDRAPQRKLLLAQAAQRQ